MSHVHLQDGGTLHLHPPSCELDLCHKEEYTYSRVGETGRRKYLWAMGLTGVVMILEVAGGLVTNSLALLSDAGHMLTHLLALAISFLAMTYSTRPPTSEKSFGFYRLEILAALFNGFILLLITFWILFEAYNRFFSPEPIASLEMMLIALVGLGTNLLTAFFLSRSKQNDINTKSVILHIAGDTFASVGVVLGAGIIAFTDWYWVDPALSVIISILILYWAVRLIRDAIDILLEATPKEIDLGQVVNALKRLQAVRDVHDVHVWTLTSGMYALSAHVALQNTSLRETTSLLKKINTLLCEQFKIGHATIQMEAEEIVHQQHSEVKCG